MGWSNLPKNPPAKPQLRSLSEVAYSVQASDWSGGKCRGKERDTACLISSLVPLGIKSENLLRRPHPQRMMTRPIMVDAHIRPGIHSQLLFLFGTAQLIINHNKLLERYISEILADLVGSLASLRLVKRLENATHGEKIQSRLE